MVLLINDYSKYEDMQDMVDGIARCLLHTILKAAVEPVGMGTWDDVVGGSIALREMAAKATALYEDYCQECRQMGHSPQSPKVCMETLGYSWLPDIIFTR
jgi:hypothetical protein